MTNGDKRLVLSCYITYSECIITIVKECMVEIVKDNTPSYINYTLYTYSIQPKVGAAITGNFRRTHLFCNNISNYLFTCMQMCTFCANLNKTAAKQPSFIYQVAHSVSIIYHIEK